MTQVIWSANEARAEGAVDSHACVRVCAVRMCIVCVCVCVCVCVRDSERALNSYYIAFKLKPAEPTPSWEAVFHYCPPVQSIHNSNVNFRVHAQRFYKWHPDSEDLFGLGSKSAYFCFCTCAMHPKVALVSSREKLEKLTLVLIPWMTKSGTLKGYPYFRNDFQEQIRRAVTVGMYAVTLAYDNVLSNQVW